MIPFTRVPHYKILIVDDSRTSTEVLKSFIRPLGYEVAVANSGEQALLLIPEIKPDLILMDIMMPGMDGFETCAALKQTVYEDIPVIFVTTQTEMESLTRGFEVGGIDYITKPAKPAEIQAKIKTHLQLRQANLDLKCLNLNKDRFFSIIARDLSDPLSAIFSTAHLLLAGPEYASRLPTDIKALLNSIHDASNLVLKKLENLLEWSLWQTGQLPCEPTTIHLQPLIEQCIQYYTPLSAQKNLHIQVESTRHFWVKADLHMLEVILLNLLNNAIRFTPTDGEIAISILETEQQIHITISDTGVGIPPGLLPKLFRMDSICVSADTQHTKGSGLGLLLCKAFIERNQGQIWVNNQPGGSGTRVTLSLPQVIP